MSDPMTPKQWLKTRQATVRRELMLAVGVGLFGGLLLIVQAHYLGRIVNAVVIERHTLHSVLPWLGILLVAFAARFVVAWAVEEIAARAAVKIKVGLRDELYRRVTALGPTRLAAERSGELANTLVDGVEAMDAYFARYLPQVSLAALIPLAILAFVFPEDWVSGLILIITAPLIPFAMFLIGKGTEALNQKQWRKLARMSAHFLDMLQGITTLKLFNASRHEAEVIARISDDYRKATMSVLRVAFLSSLALEFFATVSIALVAVLIGFRLMWGDMDFQNGFFVLLLAPEFYLPLRNMGTYYHSRMEAIGAAERIVELFEMPLPEAPAVVETLPETRSLDIRLQDVRFAYEPGREALRGIDLALHTPERVALVGASGAGKSTLASLLLGFIRPDAGRIEVNGHDLARLDPDDWRRYIAWLPQRPRIFHGTLLENIRLARPDAGPDEVRRAAALARADEFIDRLPLGYDTLVGERGQGLSGGQAQRVALARAFLKDAPFVILDEATASLDAENEALIEQALETLAKDRLLLVIAHRLRTVERADRIVVMSDGQVIEQGRHAELLQGQGAYARLVEAAA